MLGHASKIECARFLGEKGKCVSSAADRSIKFWDIEKGASDRSIFSGSTCKIFNASAYEPSIICGHADGSIRMYSSY